MTESSSPRQELEPWPELRVRDWEETRDTLHMWMQIVGKVSLSLAHPINHWWGTTFFVDARGFGTPLLPYRTGGVQLAFDLKDHELVIDTTTGVRRQIVLEPRSVADFYAEFRAKLDEVGIDVSIHAQPVEVPVAIPFASDVQHASYDRAAVEAFHRILVSADRVLGTYRARFIGKSSPVHLFWGGLDLAVTRFSGRDAPEHPGGVPNCPDYVQHLAYSHEVASAGFWPGGEGAGIFYAYAYPEPAGYAEAQVEPGAARYDEELREFVVDVADVRASDDPDAALMAFLQTTYEAVADLGNWDRAALESEPFALPVPRQR